MTGNSLLIHYQLIDKRKTLNLLVSFLKTMDLWPKVVFVFCVGCARLHTTSTGLIFL